MVEVSDNDEVQEVGCEAGSKGELEADSDGESIQSADAIATCELILDHYCALFATLYGENTMGMIHLTDVVRNHGPLFVYSCFPYRVLKWQLVIFYSMEHRPLKHRLHQLQPRSLSFLYMPWLE